MIVMATRKRFVVSDKDDFADFHIEVGGLSHDEFVAVAQASPDVAPHDEPRHLWVSTDFLHRELETSSNAERRAGFDQMLRFAAAKGWLNESGSHVAAHIVVPG